MSDLISRQAAINEIKAVYEWHDVVTEDRLIQHFKALPSAQRYTDEEVQKIQDLEQLEIEKAFQLGREDAQPGWIPVTERPIEGGQYIVTLKDDKEVWTDIAEWNPTFGGRWQAEFFDCEYCDIDNVVAWMPLPKPWEEEKAEGAATPRGVIFGIGGHPNGQKRIDGGKPL